jgi:hypothetical protein
MATSRVLPGIVRAVNLAHPAGIERADDFLRPESRSRGQHPAPDFVGDAGRDKGNRNEPQAGSPAGSGLRSNASRGYCGANTTSTQ